MSKSRDLTVYYRLEQVLSWSGSARTFRGEDPEAGRPVAVKLISLSRVPGAETLAQRFATTVGVLQSLSHPSLPEVLDSGMTPSGDAYLVTGWIEGEPLPSTGPLAPEVLLPVVSQMVEALESLSLHGLVHLNLRPDNVLVEAAGRARLVGWGGSLLTVDWQSTAARPADTTANDYGAPELRGSASAADALWRADAYSLALLTTRLLAAEIDDADSASPHVRFTKELSSQLKGAESLRAILEQCLSARPELRPDSYSAISRALQHAMPRGARRVVEETQPMKPSRTGPPSSVQPPGHALPARAEVAASALESEAPVAPRITSEAPTQVVMRDLLADVLDDPEPVSPAAETTELETDRSVPEPPVSLTDTIPQPQLGAIPTPATTTAPDSAGNDAPRGLSEDHGNGSPASTPVSDDTLPPIPPIPPIPPPPPTSPASAVPAGKAASRAPIAAKKGHAPSVSRGVLTRFPSLATRKSKVLAASALTLVGLIAVLLAVVLLLQGRAPREKAATLETGPSQVPAEPSLELPTEPPVTLPPELLAALEQIAESRWLDARQSLDKLAELEEQGELPPTICDALHAAQEVVLRARRDQILGDLRRGLERGEVASLRGTLERMNRSEERQVRLAEGGGTLIGRSKTWVAEAANLEKLLQGGSGVEALETANRVNSEIPQLARSLDARNRAVVLLDGKIDMLIEADRLEEARAMLNDLERLWPSRPRTARRQQQIAQRLESKERYNTLWTRIDELGLKRPHEGLAMLSEVEAPPELAARFEQLRETLRLRFEDLDRQAPSIRLEVPLSEIEYRKSQPIVIELVAEDDYEVKSVEARARLGGDSTERRLEVERTAKNRYRIEIPPSDHDGKPIDFWLGVSDLSGHQGALGSSQQPETLRRKPWYKRIG